MDASTSVGWPSVHWGHIMILMHGCNKSTEHLLAKEIGIGTVVGDIPVPIPVVLLKGLASDITYLVSGIIDLFLSVLISETYSQLHCSNSVGE